METILAVLLLFLQLGSLKFKEREAAHNRLQGMGPIILPLADAFAKHEDPEIATRSRRIAVFISEVKVPFNHDKIPWIDMLPPQWPNRDNVLRVYLESARSLMSSESLDWMAWRYATLLYARDLKRQGWSQAKLDAMFLVLAKAETEWWDNHRRNQEEMEKQRKEQERLENPQGDWP